MKEFFNDPDFGFWVAMGLLNGAFLFMWVLFLEHSNWNWVLIGAFVALIVYIILA